MIDPEEMTEGKLAEVKHALEELINSAGWLMVQEFITARIAGRMEALQQVVPETTEQMVRYARERGRLEEVGDLPRFIEAYYSDVCVELKKMEMESEDA
jgi:hypothetical protein